MHDRCADHNPEIAAIRAAYPKRAGEQHLAVRFGDGGGRYVVLLNGVDVSNDCTECWAGREGWVILMQRVEWAKGFQFCRYCRKPVSELVRGNVSVMQKGTGDGGQKGSDAGRGFAADGPGD